jgi:hypothetical protein
MTENDHNQTMAVNSSRGGVAGGEEQVSPAEAGSPVHEIRQNRV